MKRFASSLCMVLALAGIARAQSPKDNPERVSPTKELHRLLQVEIDTRGFEGEIKLADFLELVNDRLKAVGKPEIRFLLDPRAYREFNDVKPGELAVKLDRIPAKFAIRQLLQRAMPSIEIHSEFIVRGGHVEILPQEHTGKSYLLNHRIDADYDHRPLEQVLEDLAEQAGLTVVLDPRVKERAKAIVTARFRGDVAVQDAVRMVSEMADLKLVHLVSGLYVTTPEHAAKLQKELREIYEPQPNAAQPMGLGGAGPIESPLAPPLPPTAQRLGGM